MAGTGREINAPKKTQSIKSSLLGVIIKAQSSLSPTRKSDSSLLKSRQESSKQGENHLSQKLWFSLKKLSSSASDFSKHAPINWTTYFSTPSHRHVTETPGQPQIGNTNDTCNSSTSTQSFKQPQIETTSATCNSSTSTQSFNPFMPGGEGEEAYEDTATEPNTQIVSEATVLSSSPSLSSDAEHLSHLSTVWHVTPATPENVSAGTPAEESPVFDWSNFDWTEGESDPPRGLIFPFPIRPISRSESCQSVLMGSTGSQTEFEL